MSVTNSDDFYSPGKDYFAFNLNLLCLIGLWPKDNWTKMQKNIYSIYETVLHIFPIIYTALIIIGTYHNIAALALFLDNLHKCIGALNFIIKYIIFTTKQKKISILINEIKYSGDKITKRCNQLMIIHVVLISSLTFFVLVIYLAVTIINREMVIKAWLPFDPSLNMRNLLIASILLISLVSPAVIRGSAMQGIVCSIIMYLCEQLIELQNRIRALAYVPGNDDEFKYQFKEIIKKHVRIMRYAKNFKNIVNEYFVQNLAITVELCLNAVMITVLGFEEKKLLFGALTFLCAALLNAYIYCYLGNQLIVQSEGIAQAAYDASWTSWPVRLQKDMLIVIISAQKPLSLSAGSMGVLSMEMFGQALYNGYSIFAVLNDVVD
ncbi:LOW QUALITY PROTEIN: olfactory receptor 18 [Aphomia sociella]